MHKVLLIDKQNSWTSFDVVAKIRGSLRAQNPGQKIKVGHAGTLDPFATGLLIVLIGSATKEQDAFMKLDKEYEATLKLGHVSSTGDPEGLIEKVPSDKYEIKNKSQATNVIKKFIGEIEQTPPIYSAIKIDGERAYKLARAGKAVEMKPRKITIHQIEVVEYSFPELQIKVKCSSGTYIRTLAEDIGKKLGCGAYLTELRRTKIGNYNIKDANKVKEAIDILGQIPKFKT